MTELLPDCRISDIRSRCLIRLVTQTQHIRCITSYPVITSPSQSNSCVPEIAPGMLNVSWNFTAVLFFWSILIQFSQLCRFPPLLLFLCIPQYMNMQARSSVSLFPDHCPQSVLAVSIVFSTVRLAEMLKK